MGRFVGIALAHFFQTDLILLIYAFISIGFSAYISAGHGHPAVGVLISLYFFESLMYPSIFVLGTANLGSYTPRGAGILVMGVSGGAVFPPIQGAIADKYSTRISYLVPMVGFIVVAAYATYHWIKHGFKVKRDHQGNEVIVAPVPREKMIIYAGNDAIEIILEHQRKHSKVGDLDTFEPENVDIMRVVNPYASAYTN